MSIPVQSKVGDGKVPSAVWHLLCFDILSDLRSLC